MVRLFVPEGEGQHALARRRPGALPAQPDLLASPLRSCIAAAGITGFLALVGRSRPGIFLQSAAIFGVFDLSYTACDIYGRRELNRGVFRLDGVEAKPGTLWERTKHWTVEDAALSGGGLGIFTALNPRALPGVSGWKRFLGSAMVGAAFGSVVGERLLVRIPPQLLTLIETADTMTRRTQYERLQHNEEAKATLSRFGKLALTIHTWPALQLLRGATGLEIGHGHAHGGMSSAKGVPQPLATSPHPSIAQQLQNTITFHVEFSHDELDGPDIEDGSRAYKDTLQTRDPDALQAYLSHLHSLKRSMVLEARYIWRQLAQKEQIFYSLLDEDAEKDLYRREIQLLNSVATQFISREAILAFHVADARKQLAQMKGKDGVRHGSDTSASSSATPDLETDHSPTFLLDPSPSSTSESTAYSPDLTTAQLRTVWTRQKEVLAHIEQVVSQYDAVEAHSSTSSGGISGAGNSQVEQLRLNRGYLEKNIEATGRLLREFEEQVRRAEEQKEGKEGRER
ncbi:Nn.00g053250.m01.CDS01 [Neocucurbitaria sp. VM-36]